jgi:PTH2 family peptidyl-tRNA hydrolase
MKQVIVIRKDLNMRKGKIIAQGAHASMQVLLDVAYTANSINREHPVYEKRYIPTEGSFLCIPLTSDIEPWLMNKFTKIVVGVDSKDELLDIYNKAKEADLLCSLITDAGLTEFNGVPAYTAVAVGPGPNNVIGAITGDLKLL